VGVVLYEIEVLIMASITVKNKKGTAENLPPDGCTSWLDYWIKVKGKKPVFCEVNACIESPEVGGHVFKTGHGGKEYVLPICEIHSDRSEDESYQVWEDDLVPVNS